MTLAMRDQEIREESRAEERREGVKALIEALREIGVSEDIIQLKLMQKYSLSRETAEKYLSEF